MVRAIYYKDLGSRIGDKIRRSRRLVRHGNRGLAQACVETLEGRCLLSTVMIPTNLSALPGRTIQVPVNINDANGLQAFDFSLSYDTESLDLTNDKVTAGRFLPSGWAISADVNDAAGYVNISGFTSGDALTGGSGTLVNLAFTVPTSAPAGSTTLDLEGELNEGTLSAAFSDGAFKVNRTPVRLSIPTTLNGERGQLVHVPINIDKAAGLDALDLSITYDTNVLDLADQQIIAGDLLAGWTISANVDDAAGYVSLSAFNNGQTLASGSGTIIDLAFMVSSSSSVTNTTLDLEGQLNEGDIQATMSDGTLAISGASTKLAIPMGLSAYPGETVNVPVTIDNVTGLQAIDMTLSYDSSLLDLTEQQVTAGSLLPEGWAVGVNVDDAQGLVYVSAFATGEGLASGSGTLLNLAFTVASDAPLSSSYLDFEAELNEGTIPALVMDGDFTVADRSAIAITGNADQDDVIRLVPNAEGTTLDVFINNTTATPTASYPLAGVTKISVNGLSGDDKLELDFTNRVLSLTEGLRFDGGDGSDSLAVIAAKLSGTVLVSTSQIRFGSTTISTISSNSSILSLKGSTNLQSLTISGGQVELMDAAEPAVLEVGSLTIQGGGSLDLWDNNLILRHNDADHGASRSAALTEQVLAALYTNWGSVGITSSSAKTNEIGSTSLAVFNNDLGDGLAVFEELEGQAVDANCILVKYTYFGDGNLDGQVTGDDYALMDLAWSSEMQNPGWLNGDVNYDGSITGDDYALVDAAWSSQSQVLAGRAAETVGLLAAPQAAVDTPLAAINEPVVAADAPLFDEPLVVSAPEIGGAFVTPELAVNPQQPKTVFRNVNEAILSDDVAVLDAAV